ncbi:hypothetical protein CMO93_04700 [Candidatus Woesearchaeota archaeon]|jgi:hypothetical protein|nr:hypothetical protein [Candidatus Woesearchaeota archaeon]|tara:strand:- start:517 stop:735 length:219 start_codon:yes stop_codon:yes gene_type:complete
MPIKKLTFAFLLLIVLGLFFLSGCGGGGESDKKCDACKNDWQEYRECLEQADVILNKDKSECPPEPGCPEKC